MTNRLAVILGTLILCAIALDIWNGWGGTLFLARKVLVLMDWVAFWR